MPLSEDEIRVYRKTFSSFDRDGNGTISAEELGIGLDDLGMNRRELSIRRMIDEVDADKDNELNFDEFLELVQSPGLAGLFDVERKQENQRQESVRGLGLGEIYGQTPAPEETEERIASGLEQLRAELDKIGDKKKEGFNQALEKCPGLIDDNFLLMFLRTEVFQAEHAAKRLVTYWDKRIEVFGEKAFLPLTLDEALADDAVALSLGFIRPTGQSDACGRGIVFLDFAREGKAEYTSMSLGRAVWYAVHAMLEDEKVQQEGIVFIVKNSESLRQWDVNLSKNLAGHIRGAIPVRIGCFHVLRPKPFIKILVQINRLLLGKKLRNRIRVHGGMDNEQIEAMAGYGIPASAIPDIWGGGLDYEDRQKWLEDRREIENDRK